MKAWMGLGVVLATVAGSASGQTFVNYTVLGENLSGGGGVNPSPGDIIRVHITVNHDGHSYAGGQFDIIMQGVQPGGVLPLEEDGSPLPPPVGPAWSVGRNPLTRISVSDRPAGSVDPGNRPVSVQADPGLYGVDTIITDDQLSAGGTGWFDVATTPPGLGGLAGSFPIADGDSVFVFDFVFPGGVGFIDVATPGTAWVWANATALEGTAVSAASGGSLWWPTPGTLSVLAFAFAFPHRRRRQS